MSNIVLEVLDISCAHCAHTITDILQKQPGVESVRVNVPAKEVHLSYDESALSLDQVGAVLDEEGYPVAGTRAAGAAPAPRRNVIPLTGK
jgi:copper chaperone